MTDGSYVLMGYPQDGPAAFITAEDAEPLRQALQAAFGTAIEAAASGHGNGKDTGSVLPGHDALRTKQVQP